jgi:hypothetical protein
MARAAWAVFFAALLTVTAGCQVSLPRWLRPGTVDRQQDKAVLYDPYPDNELGPEIVGGRPREYQQQVPTSVRSQPRGPAGNWQLTP